MIEYAKCHTTIMNKVIKTVLTIIVTEEEGESTIIINRQDTINDSMTSTKLKETEEEDGRGDAIVGSLVSM